MAFYVRNVGEFINKIKNNMSDKDPKGKQELQKLFRASSS